MKSIIDKSLFFRPDPIYLTPFINIFISTIIYTEWMVLKLDKENLFVKIDNDNHYH